jgi:molybdopterin-synthase adenylyltransferase
MAEATEDTFDRQRRIDWWRQDVIEAARVLVIGAGAIGNELIKNLVLLGFRDLLIWDFDAIEASNLSRTVLFRREDIGKSKAQVAAERARAMALHPDPRIEWREGDVVWDLGLGLVRSADLVFGCLDNVEARMAINRACRLVGVPWIDSGISELNCYVSVYLPSEGGCYECGMSKSDYHEARRRYSCDNVKRSMVAAGRIPTVQIASAWSAAVQVQEGIKVLHGRTDMDARKIGYIGTANYFDIYTLPRRQDCLAHASLPEPQMLPFSRRITLRHCLDELSRQDRSGPGARIDLQADREFVVEAACRRCQRPRRILKPQFRVFEADLECQTPRCEVYGDTPQGSEVGSDIPTRKVVQAVFGANVESEPLLDMTLADLGIPDQHILPVEAADQSYVYYELAPE